MKKLIVWLLIPAILAYNLNIPIGLEDDSISLAYITLASPFTESPVRKRALIVDDTVLMDVGTLASLTGYECVYWGDTIIFERGIRKIAVKPDGSVRYYYTNIDLKLSMVISEQAYTYIPLSAGLRMLGGIESVQGNKVYVICNEFSLVDNFNAWDMDDVVFNYERDLPIRSVTGVKVGIFIANIFDNGFTYIINSVSAQGPNADKYRDATIYYLTYDNVNTTLASIEREKEFIEIYTDFFGGGFVEDVSIELKAMPSYLHDADLMDGLSYLTKAADKYALMEPLLDGFLLYSKIDGTSLPQIDTLRATVKMPDGTDKQQKLGLSLYRAVNNAIDMADNKFGAYWQNCRDLIIELVDQGLNERNIKPTKFVVEKIAGQFAASAVTSTLIGFQVGNLIMQTALAGEFENMDKFDLAFCLKDMQDKTLIQYNECRQRIWEGSTNQEDYVYVYNAMQFLNNSNIAICQLLTEVYNNKKSAPGVQSMISYWQTRIGASSNHYYASRIALEECMRDAIPTDLLSCDTNIDAGSLQNDFFIQGTNELVGYVFPHSDTERINAKDLACLNQFTLSIAKNEIFARYGYIFKNSDLKSYFENMPWYSPDANVKGTFDELNTIEAENVTLIDNEISSFYENVAELYNEIPIQKVYNGTELYGRQHAWDLNYDGEKEIISFYVPDDSFGESLLEIESFGKTYSIAFTTTNAWSRFFIADLDINDGLMQVIIEEDGGSADPFNRIFEFDGSSIMECKFIDDSNYENEPGLGCIQAYDGNGIIYTEFCNLLDTNQTRIAYYTLREGYSMVNNNELIPTFDTAHPPKKPEPLSSKGIPAIPPRHV